MHKSLKIAFSLCLAALMAAPAFAADKQKVTVGFIGPISGGSSAVGLGSRNAAELAVSQRNADPNSKYVYEMEVLDDECKPNVGVQVATKMATNKKVSAAVTHYCSSVAMSTVEVYDRFKLPVVIYGAVSPDITYGEKSKNYKTVFRNINTLINQNEQAVKFMLSLGYKSVAIIHDTTDYGVSHKNYFEQFANELGLKIVGVFGATVDQQDFSTELTKIKAADPDVVYLCGLTPMGVRVRLQMEKLGVPAQYETVSGCWSESFVSGSGVEIAEGTLCVFPQPIIEKMPGGKKFLDDYAKQYPDQFYEAVGPYSYAGMVQVLDVIEKVGPDRKKIAAELANTKGRESIVGSITFDEAGQNIEPSITIYVVQDGKWTPFDDSDYASGKRALKKR